MMTGHPRISLLTRNSPSPKTSKPRIDLNSICPPERRTPPRQKLDSLAIRLDAATDKLACSAYSRETRREFRAPIMVFPWHPKQDVFPGNFQEFQFMRRALL